MCVDSLQSLFFYISINNQNDLISFDRPARIATYMKAYTTGRQILDSHVFDDFNFEMACVAISSA